ncbi:LOW QUALITY PROTEIN: uncharacterized protein [Amphiura filiformis]|uniref:LOW QUALITY PROTEIN: uncharacterized protein n=1 Tax=Amphiura filiformis TaxID=82378 RepID=UPI003B220215
MESVKFVNQTPTNKVNEFYHEARSAGCAPGNYCKVQILGDERAGKTSLWKKLMGKKFDPQEPSTFGIDTQMCRVKEVDKSWQEREYEKGSEVADCIIWRFKNKHRSEHKNQNKEEAFKLDYILHLLFGFCLCVLLGFSDFIRLVGFSNCMKLAVCVALIALIWTKNVQMYLTVKNVADAIFTVNLICGMIFTKPVPNFALGFVSFILTIQRALVGVCQIRMGQSIVLGTILLCYTSDNNANWLSEVDVEHCVCIALGCALGSGVFPYLATWIAKVDTSVFTRRSLALEDLGIVFFLVFCTTLILSVCNNDKMIWFVVAFSGGFADEVGITLGHRLTISKYFISKIMKNRPSWSVPAIINGWILVKLCHDSIPPANSQVVVNIVFGVLPLAFAEWYRNQLHEYTSAALNVARRTEESTAGTMPLNLSLWDFAGQDFYYNTHHTFMSAHAVYIIVFDLVKYKTDRSGQTNRIHFVDSIRQHSNSSIFLVGTHKDCVDDRTLSAAQCHLKDLFRTSNLVYNKHSSFFAVDNTKSTDEDNDDVGILREKIHEEALKVKHLSEEYPIKWREFSEFIKDSRSTSAAHMPFITVSELLQVVNKYHIKDMKELLHMLSFFHDNGDVIYDSVDCVLRQFVILNPQVMIDIMQALVVVPEFPEMKFRSAWQHFERTGF